MSGMTDGGMYLPFTNSDLSSGVMTVNHSLGTKYNSVSIYDGSGILVIPDNVIGKVIFTVPKIGWIAVWVKGFFTS